MPAISIMGVLKNPNGDQHSDYFADVSLGLSTGFIRGPQDKTLGPPLV